MLHCRVVLSEVENDIRIRPRAAHEYIPGRWSLKWLRLISYRSADQSRHACVADSGAAGPSHGNIAGFSKFKETIKPFVPCDSEPAARKRYWRAATRPALWLVRSMFDPVYTGSDTLQTGENFHVYIPGGHAPL